MKSWVARAAFGVIALVPGVAASQAADADVPGFVERARDRYEWLREHGVKPTLGSILPGSFLAVGIDVRKERLFGTSLGVSAAAAWSLRGYQAYDVYLGRIKGRAHRAELGAFDADLTSIFNDNSLLAFGTSVYVHARHRIYPRIDFFGPGQAATLDGRSDFGVSGTSVDLVAQWQPNGHFGVSGRVGSIDVGLSSPTNRHVPDIDDVYTEAFAPGLTAQRPYRVAGGSVTLDYRDEPNLPSSGTFAGVALWHASPSPAPEIHEIEDDSAQAWSRMTADVRQFLPLSGKNHVVALHLLLSTTVGAREDSTPFYFQPTLGGSKTLRGFGSYRLRGDAVWAGTVEYRWQAHKWVQVAPFLDFGAVADRWTSLSGTAAAATPGIGIRATSDGRVIGRLDVARGRDGTRAVLTLSTPF